MTQVLGSLTCAADSETVLAAVKQLYSFQPLPLCNNRWQDSGLSGYRRKSFLFG
jgi:hypothetical protein